MHPTSGFAEGSGGLYGYPALSSDFFIGESDDWLIGYPIPTSRAGSLRKEPIESQNHDSALRGLSGVFTDEPFGSSFNTLEELVEVVKDFDPPLNYITPTEGDGNGWFRAMVQVLSTTQYQSQLTCALRTIVNSHEPHDKLRQKVVQFIKEEYINATNDVLISNINNYIDEYECHPCSHSLHCQGLCQPGHCQRPCTVKMSRDDIWSYLTEWMKKDRTWAEYIFIEATALYLGQGRSISILN